MAQPQIASSFSIALAIGRGEFTAIVLSLSPWLPLAERITPIRRSSPMNKPTTGISVDDLCLCPGTIFNITPPLQFNWIMRYTYCDSQSESITVVGILCWFAPLLDE